MQQKQRSPHSPLRTRAISLLLAAVLILGLVPGFTGEASAHWADGYPLFGPGVPLYWGV